MSAPLEKLSPEQVEHKLQNDHGNDKFKCSFKYYKRKTPPADLSNVIDFTRSTNPEVFNFIIVLSLNMFVQLLESVLLFIFPHGDSCALVHTCCVWGWEGSDEHLYGSDLLGLTHRLNIS